MHTIDLDAELAALPALSLKELRERWVTHLEKPAPRVSARLLRLALAWELQASIYGGLSRRSAQRLDQLAEQAGVASKVKTRLVREWKGVLHTVIIDHDGAIHYEGKSWRSLSEVARTITGTNWSGPAFFGLRKNAA